MGMESWHVRSTWYCRPGVLTEVTGRQADRPTDRQRQCVVHALPWQAGQPAPSNFGQCGRARLVVSKVNSAACLMNIEA